MEQEYSNLQKNNTAVKNTPAGANTIEPLNLTQSNKSEPVCSSNKKPTFISRQ